MNARFATGLWLAVVLWGSPAISAPEAQTTIRPTQNASKAPELALKNLDGGETSLAGQRGKVVAVNFWATWCPPCREELPSMQNTYEAFKEDGFEILAVNVGENWETIAPFLENFSVSFPVLLDQDSEAIGQWKVLGLPTTFLVDENGTITHRINGGRDWDDPQFRKELEAIIKSQN